MKLYESAPPGAKAENWVQSNKERFKKRYGEKAGERVLYAKAWKLFGEGFDPDQGSEYYGSTKHGIHVHTDDHAKSNAFAKHYLHGHLSDNKSNRDKFSDKFHNRGNVFTHKKSGDRFRITAHSDQHMIHHVGTSAIKESSDWFVNHGQGEYFGTSKGGTHVSHDGSKEGEHFAKHWLRGHFSDKKSNQKKFDSHFKKVDSGHYHKTYQSTQTGKKYRVDHDDIHMGHHITPLKESKSDEEKAKEVSDWMDKHPPSAKAKAKRKIEARAKSKKMLAAFQRVANVKEDTAPTNVMGDSASNPDSPPIKGFSPLLGKKPLKRKLLNKAGIRRLRALLQRGLG